MTRATIYVRFSPIRQAERELSLPDQIAQCQAYCTRHDWEVVEIFCEPGTSALDEDRPVFQEMIYKATRTDHPCDVIVVHSLSRFSRDALHSEFHVRQLAKAGVRLVSITQDIGHEAGGEFIRRILNMFDEHQSRENAKHVHRAMLENARQGFWIGATAPFGYLLDVDDPSLHERLVSLRFRRDELAKEITDLQRRLASAEPMITPEKVARLAVLLREKLNDGPPELRQAYARLILREVAVDDPEIRICGSKSILAQTAANDLGTTTPSVLSFVPEWRAREDSNL